MPNKEPQPTTPFVPSVDSVALQQWIGRSETLHDHSTLAPLQALSATLDRADLAPKSGDSIAPCWQWLYFLPIHPLSGIGVDGHPKRGGFLPPVPLPRRMWAGSRLVFHHALLANSAISRTSHIASVNVKQGRTGELVFVQVHHAISDDNGLAVTEEQDIVYRGMPQAGDAPQPPAAPTNEQFSRRIQPDPVLLFRYSALTFNSHRIHYDRPYAMDEESYAGLVVHGPLIATLLIDQLRRARPELQVKSYSFKAVSPLLDTAAFEVCGRIDGDVATLWARGAQGQLAMQATATVE